MVLMELIEALASYQKYSLQIFAAICEPYYFYATNQCPWSFSGKLRAARSKLMITYLNYLLNYVEQHKKSKLINLVMAILCILWPETHHFCMSLAYPQSLQIVFWQTCQKKYDIKTMPFCFHITN